MTITNNTGYSCNFIDGTKTPIAVENGASLTYTFTSSPLSYSFGPNGIPITTSATSGTIGYDSISNSFSLSSVFTPGWYNSSTSPFQIYLTGYQSSGNTKILNKNSSLEGSAVVSGPIGAYPLYSGSLSSAPASATFTLNSSTGAIIQTIQGNLTNNSNTIAYGLQFYDSNGQSSYVSSLAANATTLKPNSSTSVKLNNQALSNDSSQTFFVTVDPSTASSNIFGSGSVINTSSQTVYINYTTTLGAQGRFNLNGSYASKPIITGTSYLNVYPSSSSNTVLVGKTIDANSTWYINSTNGVWTIDLAPITTTQTMLNNYNQATGQITFYNSSTGVSSYLNSLNSWAQTSIPTGTTKITCTGLANNGTFYFIPADKFNMYTNSVITNSSSSSNNIILYASGVAPINNPSGSYTINKNQSLPLVTGETHIHLYEGSTIFAEFDAQPNTSYNITGITGSLMVQPYTPRLQNNSSQQITNLDFYNSNNQKTTYESSLAAGGYYTTPTTTSFLKFDFIANSRSSNITVPITFPLELDLLTDNTITNSSGEIVQINYYGNYNLATNSLLTTPALSMAAAQILPIFTGALNIQVLDVDGNEIIPLTALAPGVSYFILYNSGVWRLSTTNDSGFYLTNNSSQATSTITFKDSFDTLLGSTPEILGGGSYPIPFDTAKIECTGLINDNSCNIQATDSASINIYNGYVLTNNTDYEIVATYYGLENSVTVVNGTIAIPARRSVDVRSLFPIVTSTTKISVTQNSTIVIPQQSIVNTASYIINFDGVMTWSMDTYTPTLQNNSSQNGTNLTFFTPTGGVISSGTDFPAGTTITNPSNGASASVYIYGTTLTIPIDLGNDSYLFTDYTVTNLATETVDVTFYGPSVDEKTPPLNNPGFAVFAGQNIPIITGSTSISVLAGGTSAIPQTSIVADSPYFINSTAAASPSWYLSTSIPLSNALFINNYNQTITDLTFYNGSGIDLYQTIMIPTFEAWQSTSIPANTTLISFYYTNNAGSYRIELSYDSTNPVSINAFTGYAIHNNTENNELALWLNGSQILNNPGIITASNESTPIVTYTQGLTVTSPGQNPTTTYIPFTEINPYASYYIIYDIGTDTYSLVQTVPTQAVTFTNNYNGTASNLYFYNASNQKIDNLGTSLGAYNSLNIPTSSTYTIFNYQSDDVNPSPDGNTFTVPLVDTNSSALFTNYYVINEMAQPIYILYYGTVNETPHQPLTVTKILNNNGSGGMTPIISGATNFEIYDEAGTLQATQDPITAMTDYTVHGSWSVTPTTPARLTNNSYQDATDLIFYNVTTPISDPIDNFYDQTAADVPTGATVATTDQIFNSIPSTIKVAVSDVTNSNLVTNYNLYNNSDQTVTITFYGTINSTSGQNLNSPGISIAPFTSIAITTGAVTASVTFGSTVVISNATIEPNTTYYINYIEGDWSFVPYASIVTLTNNSTTDASHLAFYDATDAIITTESNFEPYTSQSTPTNAIYASANFIAPFNATLTIPVSGASFSNFFTATNSIVTNNTSALPQNIGLIFYGTINGVSNIALNSPTIDMALNESISILTGADSFTIFDSNSNPVIVNYPIDATESYSITNSYDTDGTLLWSINTYLYGATLNNNYNQDATSLKFFDINSLQIGATQTTFPAFSSAGIPTNSIQSTFNVFESSLTIPVSATTSSTVYANVLYNKTGTSITATYYGIADALLNTPAISCPDEANIPFLLATEYAIITAGSDVLDTRDTSYNPLPLTCAYDIVYNPSLNIVPHALNLTNNFYQVASNIDFYDLDGDYISSVTLLQPFATVAIPTNPQATSAVIEYQDFTITVPLSTTNSSNVLTNNLLSNSTADDLFVIFFDVQNNALNNDPLLLQAGTAIPFITGTQFVSIMNNDSVIITNKEIISTESYNIVETNFQNRSIKATSIESDMIPTSSALGVIQLIGGQIPVEPVVLPVRVYGDSQNLFEEFLYVNAYAKVIINQTARAAAIIAVNRIVNQYADAYINQPNFNYISYIYLINPQLKAAQAVIASQYPNSAQQINLFFSYLQKRNNALLN